MLKKTTRGMTAGMTRRGVGFAVAGGAGYDTDAQAYITLVEAADSQSLETGVKDAINAFVVGCKSDGIWDAIKAACILAGARTLNGALVPLVGTAPTNNNFVSGDYNRETGLLGNGTTKYLDSNRTANADPQDDFSMSVFVASLPTFNTSRGFIAGEYNSAGSESGILCDDQQRLQTRCRNTSSEIIDGGASNIGFKGISRNLSTEYTLRFDSANTVISSASSSSSAEDIFVFCRGQFGGPSLVSDARLSFYSIGESLDLALLDSRVSTLMTAIGAAIP